MNCSGSETHSAPRTKIRSLLHALYGEGVGSQIASDLTELIARVAAPRRIPSHPDALSERDALLITYADQVREPGVAPLQTLAEFAGKHLRNVVSGIHLLPFYPWSSDDGFAVMDFFAVAPDYGTWEQVGRLSEDFDLMFDAVFNHASAQGDWFQRFLRDEPEYRNFFLTVEGSPDLSSVIRPRTLPLLTEFQTIAGPKRVWTTFSADQADLNLANPQVLLRVTEALLWLVRQGGRFIRLDAIAYLWKEIGTPCIHLPQTHLIIQFWRAVLDEFAPHVRLITETNVPHADNISYFGDGTNEAQLVYNFALPPLVLHSLQNGNAQKMTRWAQALTLPSDQATFLNFLASHDGIGLNPVRGILSETEIEALVARTLDHGGFISYKNLQDGSSVPYELNINYLDALSNPLMTEALELAARKFLTAQAIMLSLRGMPGIYFHSLFGSRGDRAAAETSGIPRRINRQRLHRDRLEAELAQTDSLRALVFRGYSELLRVRGEHRAFAPLAEQQVLNIDPRVFAVLRETADGKDRVLCLHNVSSEKVDFALPAPLDSPRRWRVTLSRGAENEPERPAHHLAPLAFSWLALNDVSSM